MSKGTKQIRLGRVERFIEKLNDREAALESLLQTYPDIKAVSVQILELQMIRDALKKEFEL